MASRQYLVHITAAGDRWDLLAWQFYGDPTAYGAIVMANPDVPIVPVFDAGVAIQVPVLARTTVRTADLPPWKNAAASSSTAGTGA
jgi:phage tail protein X